MILQQTYTEGGWSNELRWAMWVFAMFGIVYQQLFHERYKTVETTFYVLIAVMPSLAVHEMVSEWSEMLTLPAHLVIYTKTCESRISARYFRSL